MAATETELKSPERLIELCMQAFTSKIRSESVLQQIQTEHLYSTPGSGNTLTRYLYSDNDKQPSESSCGVINEFQYGVPSEHTTAQSGCSTDDQSDSTMDPFPGINADAIQRHFQEMLAMTALAPMPELDPEPEQTPPLSLHSKSGHTESQVEVAHCSYYRPCLTPVIHTTVEETKSNEVGLTDEVDHDSQLSEDRNEDNPQASPTKRKKTPKKSKKKSKNKSKESKERKETTQTKTSVSDQEWREINKVLEEERRVSTCLKHAAQVLVRKWTEYLAMTAEEINKFALKEAMEIGMVQEAIDMLQDKDRYVWQLIEELQFF